MKKVVVFLKKTDFFFYFHKLFEKTTNPINNEHSNFKRRSNKLDKAAQAELMHFMVELLSGEKNGISDEWKEEIERREKALKNGTSIGRPAREVLAKYFDK